MNQHKFYNKLSNPKNKMSQKGSRVTSPSKNPVESYQASYVTIQHPSATNLPSTVINQPSSYSTYSLPNKNVYAGTAANTYNQSRFTTEQVSQLTGSRVKEGSVVKGQSRIQYVPYEKKVIDYETRTYKEMVPKTRKVVDYQERKIVQTVPREVVKQDYYAVQKITQYYKEIIPEKKVQIVPVEKKVKKIKYVPIQKQFVSYFRQIVHYPKNEDFRTVMGQSRAVLESQGFVVKPDAQYRPIQPDLLYRYTQNSVNSHITPVGYVDLGSRRYLSTAPTVVNPNLGFSNVQAFNSNPSYVPGSSIQPINFQQSQVYSNYPQEQPTFISRVNEDNFSNVISGSKYEYRYGNVGDGSKIGK